MEANSNLQSHRAQDEHLAGGSGRVPIVLKDENLCAIGGKDPKRLGAHFLWR